MRSWTLALEPAPLDSAPLFLRVARAIADDVRRGRLRPGFALPGTRALADSLGVHRNTVIAAYRELVAEGWLTVEAARGTFVSTSIPDVTPRRFAASAPARTEVPDRVGFDLPAAQPVFAAGAPRPGVLSLAGGIPDLRLLPAAPLARAYRRALKTGARAVLSYGDPRGTERMRDALATMLSATRGLAATARNVLVTRGSQMAIDLVARTLIEPGDVVAVEALGYRQAWEALRAAGAKLAPIPVDDEGARIDALEALTRTSRVRALYVTPHHQYPTTVALSPGRRLALLDLARRHRIAVVEDDYDHEFHYDGRPLLPLASADDGGSVVYVGTLSKVLAPGLRLGYVVAPQPLVERLAARRAYIDRQGDHAIEHAVAELLDDGEVQRHVRRARRTYEERRDLLVTLLRRTFGEALAFEVPAGGTALWSRVAPEIDVDAWADDALERGVAFQPARQFAFDGRSRPLARFGFAQLTAPEMREAVRRLASALPKPSSRRAPLSATS